MPWLFLLVKWMKNWCCAMDVYQLNDTDWTPANRFYRSVLHCTSSVDRIQLYESSLVDTPKTTKKKIPSLILSWCELVLFTSSGTNFIASAAQSIFLPRSGRSPIDCIRIQKCITFVFSSFALAPSLCVPCVPSWYLLVIIINSLFRLASQTAVKML